MMQQISPNISIYGAQLLAGTIYEALKSLYDIRVNYFIVSDKNGNPDRINGIEVITLADYLLKNIKEQILIAAPEEHHQAIAAELKKNLKRDYVFLTSKLRNQILEKYYSESNDFTTLVDYCRRSDASRNSKLSGINEVKTQIQEEDRLKVYMARSSKDKALVNIYTLPDWVVQIQAGAAMGDVNSGILSDCEGDNISVKNPYYCELTALYWVWKHDNHEYCGLCHYRRIFNLTRLDIEVILKLQPDIILPYPTIHFPDISTQYIRYLSEPEWQTLGEAVISQSPEMASSLDDIWKGKYFYNYNMLIARQEVIKEFCEWLFSVIDKAEIMCRERNIVNSKRYAGYMGEILTTVFFRYHNRRWKIVHTGVDILL